MLAILLVGGFAIAYRFWPKTPPHLTLAPAHYEQLAGWHDDTPVAALPAFLRSCAAVLAKPDSAVLDAATKSVDFGRVGDWRPACDSAALVPVNDDRAARQFFETMLTPLLAANNGEEEGLFTGYFEITLQGSRQCGGRYQTPIYRRPADPARFSRAEIEDGALAGRGLELLWVDD
ncbi:MAG TPA: MltA domain-containing protein, partial [Stellaceae bacterium]|nr:MltA domain-containing protein [Stellaceae bacterium]